MANKSSYQFTEATPSHLMPVYSKDPEKPNFQTGTEWVKGLLVHGPQCGVLTEDKLTDPIVEYLLEKTDADGVKIYAQYFEKKKGKSKE